MLHPMYPMYCSQSANGTIEIYSQPITDPRKWGHTAEWSRFENWQISYCPCMMRFGGRFFEGQVTLKFWLGID